MKVLRNLMLFPLALAVVAALAIPAAAQSDSAKATSDTTEAELQSWFASLGKNRQQELKKRYQALKKLPKEKREAILKAGKEGKPVLTEEQRTNLAKLRKLSYLQRVRLYTLAAELHTARTFRSEEFKAAMAAPDRAKAMRELLAEQRMLVFKRKLPREKQAEIDAMPLLERRKALRDLFEEEAKARLAELEKIYPRVAELRVASENGDREAKKQLKQVLGDLKTLGLLIQRLEPERREKMMAELRDLSIEDAANQVRKALQDQWQVERKRNKEDKREGRGQFQPERNGNRPPENRRKRE